MAQRRGAGQHVGPLGLVTLKPSLAEFSDTFMKTADLGLVIVGVLRRMRCPCLLLGLLLGLVG